LKFKYDLLFRLVLYKKNLKTKDLLKIFNVKNLLFNKSTLKYIKKHESQPYVIKNFLSKSEINKIINIEKKSKYLVDREDGRKRSLSSSGNVISRNYNNWHPILKKILLPKLKKIFSKNEFFVSKNEFPPHIFYTKNPTRMHADTGREKNALISKQILLPLKIVPKNRPVRTIIFKNKWYGPASFFQFKKVSKINTKYFLKNSSNKIVEVSNMPKFMKKIKNLKGLVKINDEIFNVNENFKKKIKKIIKVKRYNQITNEHIILKKKFDYSFYKKYLTHQPYEDYFGLDVDLNYKWKVGDLLIWDRTSIHISDNYKPNGAIKKMGLAIFFSHKKKQ